MFFWVPTGQADGAEDEIGDWSPQEKLLRYSHWIEWQKARVWIASGSGSRTVNQIPPSCKEARYRFLSQRLSPGRRGWCLGNGTSKCLQGWFGFRKRLLSELKLNQPQAARLGYECPQLHRFFGKEAAWLGLRAPSFERSEQNPQKQREVWQTVYRFTARNTLPTVVGVCFLSKWSFANWAEHQWSQRWLDCRKHLKEHSENSERKRKFSWSKLGFEEL